MGAVDDLSQFSRSTSLYGKKTCHWFALSPVELKTYNSINMHKHIMYSIDFGCTDLICTDIIWFYNFYRQTLDILNYHRPALLYLWQRICLYGVDVNNCNLKLFAQWDLCIYKSFSYRFVILEFSLCSTLLMGLVCMADNWRH